MWQQKLLLLLLLYINWRNANFLFKHQLALSTALEGLNKPPNNESERAMNMSLTRKKMAGGLWLRDYWESAEIKTKGNSKHGWRVAKRCAEYRLQFCIRKYLKMLARCVSVRTFSLCQNIFAAKARAETWNRAETWIFFRTICFCLDFKYFSKNYASLCRNLYIIALFSWKNPFFNAMRNELNL